MFCILGRDREFFAARFRRGRATRRDRADFSFYFFLVSA